MAITRSGPDTQKRQQARERLESSPLSNFNTRNRELDLLLQERKTCFDRELLRMYEIRKFWLAFPSLALSMRATACKEPLWPSLIPIRTEFWNLPDHGIEMLLRGEVLKWGYRVWKGTFLPPEILWIIVDFMKEDHGNSPGWFVGGQRRSHTQDLGRNRK